MDCDRDKEEELEVAIRFFLNVHTEQEADDEYPIFWQAMTSKNNCRLKTISFIPLLARLAIELGLFEEVNRGGLTLKIFHRVEMCCKNSLVA